MYLLGPRSPAHFHPIIVELLKKGDGNSIRYKQSHDCANSKVRPSSGSSSRIQNVLVMTHSSSLLLVCRFHLFLELLVALLD